MRLQTTAAQAPIAIPAATTTAVLAVICAIQVATTAAIALLNHAALIHAPPAYVIQAVTIATISLQYSLNVQRMMIP